MAPTRPPLAFLITAPLALILSACFLYWSIQWVGRPFPGFQMLRSGHVDMNLSPDWSAARAGIHVGDRILALDGSPVTDPSAAYEQVALRPPGTAFRWEIRRSAVMADQQRQVITARSQRFGWPEWRQTFLAFWLPGVLHLLIGMAVMVWRPGDAAARAHWLWCLAIGYFLISGPDNVMAHHALSAMGDAGAVFVGLAGFHLAAVLPRPWPIVQRHPRAVRLLMVAAGILASVLVGLAVGTANYGAGIAGVAIGSLGALIVPASTVWTLWRRDSTLRQRSQATTILWGAVVAYGPSIVLSLAGQLFGVTLFPPEWGVPLICLFPAAVAVAIVRHQLFDIPVLIRQTTLYTLLGVSLASAYLALSTGGYALLRQVLPADGPSHTIGFLAAMAVAGLFHPLRRHLTVQVDRFFLGEHLTPAALLSQFPQSPLTDPAVVGSELIQVVSRAVNAQWATLRLKDGLTLAVGEVPAAGDAEPVLTVDLSDARDSEGVLLIGPRTTMLPYAEAERQALQVLGRHAAVALRTTRMADQQVQLRIQEATARSLATEREQALLAVDAHLRQELDRIAAAVAALTANGNDPAPFDQVRQSLERVTAYLDGMTPFIRPGQPGAEMEAP